MYRPLLQALSSTSPVCGLVCPDEDLLEVLHQMTRGASACKDVNALHLLTIKCPVIADLYKVQDDLSDVLIPVFEELRRLSRAPFVSAPGIPQPSLSTDNVSTDTGCSDFCGVAFWPNLPQKTSRGVYSMDAHRTSTQDCRKQTKTYGRMTPGIFAAFCEHGICYGFQIMEQFESPNVPFTLLATRFVTPPSVVIYDNACHLHMYSLNREPHQFRNTKFLIDRLHWPNHTACSIGYRLDSYLQYKTINSQAAEQMNASLQRIKVQISYMNQDNFLWHCRLFLWGRNSKKLCETVE